MSTPAQHAFRNAHHLRELIALAEADPVLSWPERLIALPCEANDATLAERDLRMPKLKLKRKVSGSFRSCEGAEAFATVRSQFSALREQSIDLYPALVMTFRGRPPMPRLARGSWLPEQLAHSKLYRHFRERDFPYGIQDSLCTLARHLVRGFRRSATGPALDPGG